MGDDENFGSMLNESDGFDKLINQLKQEKIEEDRNYEKQKKAKERQKEKEKIKEEEYDLNNLIYNFDNTNISNDFPKKEEKKDEEINVFNRRKTDKNDSNLFNDENKNKINKDQNNNKSKQNRRGNARHFLEETENYGGFNFGESPKKKSNEVNINNDFNNLNLGNSGEFGSLFGNKSRRRQDKNYEI